MDGTLKFYLLAEESGWDCSAYAYQYGQEIKKTIAYQVLSYNVLEARQHLSFKAQDIVFSFDHFKADPLTVKDAFILDTKLNYLALHSFPEFYLNPLAVDPNYSGEVTSLGQLMFDYEGKEVSLNEIILDDKHKPEIKKEAVSAKLDEYLSDMNRLVAHSIRQVQRRAFAKGENSRFRFRSFVEIADFILINLYLFALMVVPYEPLRETVYAPSSHTATSYMVFLYPLTVIILNLLFVTYHTYKARISEPYNYARQFLRRSPDKIYDAIRKRKDELSDYIYGAINNRIELKNDIRDFSILSSSYIDFKAVIHVSKLREKKAYRILHGLTITFLTIATLEAVIFFFMLLIGYLYRRVI